MRALGKRARALAMIAAAITSGVPVVAPSANGVTVVPAQQSSKQQLPAAAPRAQQMPVFLGGGFSYYHALNPHGCPWPGRAGARARRGPGAYWSGR